MSAVPVTLNGILYPKARGSGGMPQAVPAIFIGMASLTGLEVGGGPVFPPEWGPPVEPPVDIPPPDFTGDHLIVKPPPPTGGWGYSPGSGWGYFPMGTSAGPKADAAPKK